MAQISPDVQMEESEVDIEPEVETVIADPNAGGDTNLGPPAEKRPRGKLNRPNTTHPPIGTRKLQRHIWQALTNAFIKRPATSYALFMKEFWEANREASTETTFFDMSKRASELWKAKSEEEKAFYRDRYEVNRAERNVKLEALKSGNAVLGQNGKELQLGLKLRVDKGKGKISIAQIGAKMDESDLEDSESDDDAGEGDYESSESDSEYSDSESD